MINFKIIWLKACIYRGIKGLYTDSKKNAPPPFISMDFKF